MLEVVDWTDFTYDTLEAIYGDLLKLEVHQQDLPDLKRGFPFHLTEIRDEDSLEALLIRWNNAVISEALSLTHRGEQSGDLDSEGHGANEIFMARGGHAKIPKYKSQKGLRPDWAGIMRGNLCEVESNQTRTSYMNVLPGDSKLSTKWNTSMGPDKAEFHKPFHQICSYCDLAEVRYGYLLTQEELVVVRLSRKPNEQGPGSVTPPQRSKRTGTPSLKKWQGNLPLPEETGKRELRIIEYKSIPWEEEGGRNENLLSINLALWWLHMMAATTRSIRSEYRDLREEYQIQRTAMQNVPPRTKRSLLNSKKRRHDSGSDNSTHHLKNAEKMRPTRKFTRSFSIPMQID